MKQCLTCNRAFPSSESTCITCKETFETIEGFPAYAPSYAQEGLGFKSSYFSELAALEAKNFWFRARNRLIIWALGHYCPALQSFLEIGCGTGYVLAGIAKSYPNVLLQGSDLFTKGLTFAASRLPSVHLMQMDARYIPFVNEFDCIGTFDVLEHIKEDCTVLAQIHQALKPGGILIATVPQHRWLWSPVDEYACHVRRYTAHELHNKLKEAGFETIRSTSFVTSLLPPMFISRIIQKISKNANPDTGLNISPWLNFIFEKLINAEIKLIKKNINFPFGGSRLVVARKLDSSTFNRNVK